MIKVILCLDAGIAGTDAYKVFKVSQKDWDIYTGKAKGYDTLGDYAWQEALWSAAMYGIYPESDRPDDWDEDDSDDYSDNIEGYFELYNPEEHDGHKCSGGLWKEEDFEEI